MPADHPQWILNHCREIGDRVRERRLWVNLTQEQLAEAAGISWSSVQRVEAGSTGTAVSYYLRIARALDVDPGELVKDVD